MMSVFRFKPIPLLISLCLLLGTGCDKDDDPIAPGTLSLSPSASTYEGIRGSEVQILVSVSAEDGIATLTATPQGGTAQSITVPEGATAVTAEITFPIPGDAILGTRYPIDLSVTDKDGDREDLQVTVKTVAIMPLAPQSYEFTRDGSSTVSYSGQNERLTMVEEIKNYLKQGDNGGVVSAQVLHDAFANVGNNGNGFFSFTSTKQLKNKTFQPDLDDRLMEDLFDAAEVASKTGQTAAEGMPGLLTRENSGQTVLVDENGREFTQLIEKGLMGTVMYNQIYNTYFSNARTGDDVENTEWREGKNYTDMEHHWDEAFGYWNPPLDFTSNWPDERGSEDRFWSHYSNVVDPHLGTNDRIMKGFIEGRTAIVNNDLETKNAKRAEVATVLEEVAAATAVHYINATLSALNEGQTGEAFHVLSEAWAFTNALRYNPDRALSLDGIEKIKEELFGEGGNFWKVTIAGLNEAKSMLVAAYPALESVQDDL